RRHGLLRSARNDGEHNDEKTHLRSPAARFRPGHASTCVPRKQEGTGNAGCSAAPMARLQQKKQAAVTTGPAGTTGIPCAMVLRFIRDLPGVPGLIASIASRIAARDLTSASGGQDHTISPSAERIARLATYQASITSRPNVRGDARTPLLAGQDARRKTSDLPDGASGILVTGGVGRWISLR